MGRRATGPLVPVTAALRMPKGRTAAEQRLAAIAALHAPVTKDHGVIIRDGMTLDLGRDVHCAECSNNRFGDKVRWPCATARLIGPWPGEPTPEPTGE